MRPLPGDVTAGLSLPLSGSRFLLCSVPGAVELTFEVSSCLPQREVGCGLPGALREGVTGFSLQINQQPRQLDRLWGRAFPRGRPSAASEGRVLGAKPAGQDQTSGAHRQEEPHPSGEWQGAESVTVWFPAWGPWEKEYPLPPFPSDAPTPIILSPCPSPIALCLFPALTLILITSFCLLHSSTSIFLPLTSHLPSSLHFFHSASTFSFLLSLSFIPSFPISQIFLFFPSFAHACVCVCLSLLILFSSCFPCPSPRSTP